MAQGYATITPNECVAKGWCYDTSVEPNCFTRGILSTVFCMNGFMIPFRGITVVCKLNEYPLVGVSVDVG